MSQINVSIIIVNYKTKDITRDCLKAVFASQGKTTYEVILVDNDSGDDILQVIHKEFPQVKTIQSGENGGFAKANNLGAKSATGEYVWLLNSDTIVESDTLNKLYRQAEEKKAYIASCRLLNRDGSIQPQGGALPTIASITTWMLNVDIFPFVNRLIPPYQNRVMESFKHDRTTGWLGGTALLVRRDLYAGMGGLDDHIFMYGEDVEFCVRAAQGNIPVYYFASPQLVHLGQASGSSERSILGEFSGLKYIYEKHKTRVEYNGLRVLLKIGALLRCVMYTIRGGVAQRKVYVKAFKVA